MTTPSITKPYNAKGGQWRIPLRARVTQLHTELAEKDPDEVTSHLKNVITLVDDRETVSEWWSGSQVEQAWNEVRSAELESMQAETDPRRIIANGRAILVKAKGRVADDDSRVAALTDAISKAEASGRTTGPGKPLEPPGAATRPRLTTQPPDAPADQTLDNDGDNGRPPGGPPGSEIDAIRDLTVAVARAYVDVSNAEHQAQRQTRNIMLVLDILLGAMAVALAAVGLLYGALPRFIPTPEGLSTGAATAVALMVGAAGALFSAIPSLASAPPNATTYNPKAQQAVLKVVIGAWSALVGLVAVAASATEPTQTYTLAGFVLLCLGFGAAQEAITRFADRKVADAKPSTT